MEAAPVLAVALAEGGQVLEAGAGDGLPASPAVVGREVAMEAHPLAMVDRSVEGVGALEDRALFRLDATEEAPVGGRQGQVDQAAGQVVPLVRVTEGLVGEFPMVPEQARDRLELLADYLLRMVAEDPGEIGYGAVHPAGAAILQAVAPEVATARGVARFEPRDPRRTSMSLDVR